MIVIQVIAAGIFGTVGMTVVMYFIHRSGWANGDMIRALGSLVTKSYENSVAPGLLIHLTAGCVFAVPYTFVMNAGPVNLAVGYVGIGAALGVFHGAAMSFVLLALVADNHPVERFRGVGFEVAAAHVVGHVAYGAGVGAVWAMVGARAVA